MKCVSAHVCVRWGSWLCKCFYIMSRFVITACLFQSSVIFLPALNPISGVFVFDSSMSNISFSAFLSLVPVYRSTYFICHIHWWFVLTSTVLRSILLEFRIIGLVFCIFQRLNNCKYPPNVLPFDLNTHLFNFECLNAVTSISFSCQ